MVIHNIINEKYKLILGSASPRRKELLTAMGFVFEVKIPNINEVVDESLPPSEIVKTLSLLKSKAINLNSSNEILITADTIVFHKNKILGKPSTKKEAKIMLTHLSGNTHQVFSGITIRSNNKCKSDFVCTDVQFKNIKPAEIDYYINNYKPFDKAGSYGIQEWIGYHKIAAISGSYFNVVGLPCSLLSEMLEDFIR